MVSSGPRSTVQPGETAPDFTLPLAAEDGQVSLADYRGRSPLLLVLLRSMWCPFCRRHIARLGGTSEKLRSVGVETLAVGEDRPDAIRRYFRLRPPRVRVATDMERNIHRAYGCPLPPITPEYKKLRAATRINPTGEAPEAMSVDDAQSWLRKHDRFGAIPEDQAVMDQLPPRDFNIHAGHFLIDPTGVVRWAQIETPIDDLSRWGMFPTDDHILAAIRTTGF